MKYKELEHATAEFLTHQQLKQQDKIDISLQKHYVYDSDEHTIDAETKTMDLPSIYPLNNQM